VLHADPKSESLEHFKEILLRLRRQMRRSSLMGGGVMQDALTLRCS